MDVELLMAASWRLQCRRSRSLDSILRDLQIGSGRKSHHRRSSSSRSVSPSGHSSSLESHSIKDSPIQLTEHDGDSVSDGTFSELGGAGDLSHSGGGGMLAGVGYGGGHAGGAA